MPQCGDPDASARMLEEMIEGLDESQRKDFDGLTNLMALCDDPLMTSQRLRLARDIILGKKPISTIPYKRTPAETYSKFQELIKRYEVREKQ